MCVRCAVWNRPSRGGVGLLGSVELFLHPRRTAALSRLVPGQPASRLYFHARRKEEIYVKPFAGGRHQQLLLSVEGNAEVDGGLRMAVLSSSDYIGTKNGADVWALPLFGERKPFPFPSKSPMPLR